MRSFSAFIRDFFSNKGQYVFVSLLIAKICGFAGSLLIIRILPESEFGLMSIVASVFSIFAPFNGFGSTQSLLRFGSIVEDESEKKALSQYLFRKGFINQLLLSLVFLAVSVFYVQKYDYIFWIFLCFTVRLIGIFFLAHIQSELRINGQNLVFARVGNVVNSASLIMLLVFSYFWGLKGYLLAMMISPYIALFWAKNVKFSKVSEKIRFRKSDIWQYALHSSGTASLSDALFSADILILSFLMNETAVANYKVAILLPSNITFLALTFMQSDFPTLAKNYQQKEYLKNYIWNYYKLFVPICIVIFAVGVFWSEEMLHLFFSERYSDNSFVFTLLLAAFCLNMLFRNLYGNLLSAVGWMKANTIVSAAGIVLLLCTAFFYVPKYGVNGMAAAMAFTLFSTGIILLFYFILYLKKLK